ncbi:hypothetical protein GALMADRAFT_277717 [Galerina marginata CBS 339.88]|uniref:RING-type domain-containing protein n=1 Tax=Galerina marginata (strain CBS 339.88) TaxID=685588 RepID=A0A067TJR8_GALM3|nr:hypothetical protein GALMADRAFT_277717 [Galerina marginata CBS 339.88]
MLVLHSSSRCDVCLSEYHWETTGKRPYAIACGHIFCRDCLYTNSPPLCPLCRKPYQPNKMKKLHVDRPENIDDHREIDLLQRLAISWDTPEEQLEELTAEVDLWLRDRSDDSCIALRRARAALTKHREFEEAEAAFEDAQRELTEQLEEHKMLYRREQTQAAVSSEAYGAKIDSLTKCVCSLKLEIESLQIITQRYTRPGNNPLPRPPEPISTDHVPTFEQAMSESGTLGVRFAELPVSPRSIYSFEIESSRSSRKKGKSKVTPSEASYFDDANLSPNPRYQTATSPSASSSHYVRPHVAQSTTPAPSSQYDHSPNKQSTRAPGLQLHFDNTAQPLDAFALTHAYLREYSTGFVNGQEAAAAANTRKPSEYPKDHSTYPGQGSSSRHPPQVQPATAFEPSQSYHRATTPNTYQNQPYSAPVPNERSSRPTHRRQPTAPSIISSASSLSMQQNGRSSSRSQSQSRSRSRSRPRGSSSMSSHSNSNQQYGNPVLASILSTDTTPSRTQSFGSVSPEASRANTSNFYHTITAPLQPQPRQPQPQQYQPQPQQHQPQPQQHSRASSIISNNLPSNTRPNSPSSRSFATLQSNDTWGTATPSHLANGSLISGLNGFRFGAEPSLVGGRQERLSFHELASDGASIRTREMSFSEMGAGEPAQASMSPARPVHSMVGVLPADGENSYRSPPRDERATYRSPTSVDTRSYNGWNANANGSHTSSTRHRNSNSNNFVSGYQTDDDRSLHRQDRVSAASSNHWNSQSQSRDERDRERPGTYRSQTSVDPHSRAYDGREERDRDRDRDRGRDGYSHSRSQSYTSTSAPSRNYVSSNDRHDYQQQAADDLPPSSEPARESRSRRPGQPRTNHLSLPAESPFPVIDEYPEDDRHSNGNENASPGAGHLPVMASFGNALGLELTTGPTPISAPTPQVSSRPFLRSWSRDHYES